MADDGNPGAWRWLYNEVGFNPAGPWSVYEEW